MAHLICMALLPCSNLSTDELFFHVGLFQGSRGRQDLFIAKSGDDHWSPIQVAHCSSQRELKVVCSTTLKDQRRSTRI